MILVDWEGLELSTSATCPPAGRCECRVLPGELPAHNLHFYTLTCPMDIGPRHHPSKEDFFVETNLNKNQYKSPATF